MDNELNIIHNITQKTRAKEMTWYIENDDSVVNIFFICVVNIFDKKRLVFRFNANLSIEEYYLSIKMIHEKKRSTNRRNIKQMTSNNLIYGPDMDLIYHAIRYTRPMGVPDGFISDY